MHSERREDVQPIKDKVANRYPPSPNPEAYWISVIL